MGSLVVIIVAIFPLVSCSSFEPQCSKFHYEEKLLEKMIRQEISVDAMRKEIETSRNQVETALNTLQNERIIWEKSLQAKSDKSATDLAAVIQETKTKVQEEMTKLENKKTKWNSELKDFVRIQELVLFSARNPKDTKLTSGLIMVFTEVLLNEGGAYNKANGVFTVPYDGVYTFSVQLCVYPGRRVDFAFMANDKPFKHVRIYRHSTSYFSCYNYDAVTIVRKNDQVTIKVTDCSSGTILGENIGHFWNMFSGRLLYTN